MTSGEKMIWANVFVREFMLFYSDPPTAVMRDEEAMEVFEKDAAENAAEVACHVVQRIRSVINMCEESYGVDSEVVHMLNAMLGVDG